MIVPDGRTDAEKLSELLTSPEQTHLEFKSTLDLTSLRHKLNFVKDAVTMTNTPPGGYILVGVEDGGDLALPSGSIEDRSTFDSARLADLIKKYADGVVQPISQIHDLDGHEVVLIYLPHPEDGLPVPMSKEGSYRLPGDKKQTIVFRPGDVLVREGAQNVPLRHIHWATLLKKRDDRIRSEAREQVDALIADLAVALRARGGVRQALVPLSLDMTDESFAEAVISHLDAGNDVRLRQFLQTASASSLSVDAGVDALDKIVIVAAQAMHFEQPTVVTKATDALYRAYENAGDDARLQLDIITRVYVLGSMAVRLCLWETVHDLALRPYTPTNETYIHSSWIRHGQVAASRAGLFEEGKAGMMISGARELMRTHPTMRPDMSDTPDSGTPSVFQADGVLNSLCQFDILYCLVVMLEGQHHGGAYPAASGFDQSRANPAFETVAHSPEARKLLFPTSDVSVVAKALDAVWSSAKQQSLGFMAFWGPLPPIAEHFVNQHSI